MLFDLKNFLFLPNKMGPAKLETRRTEPKYKLHDKVMFRWTDNKFYEAKIAKISRSYRGEPVYTLNFKVT